MPVAETVHPYVVCEYCQTPIYADKDMAGHATDCGAPLPERKRIDAEVKRLDAAVALSEGVTPIHPLDSDLDAEMAERRRAQPAPPVWRDPQVEPEWVYVAQAEIDAGKIVIGGLSAGKKCVGKHMVDGHELPCPHLTVMRSIQTNECDLQHKHTETIMQLCLIHWVRLLAAGLPPAGLGPLLDDV